MKRIVLCLLFLTAVSSCTSYRRLAYVLNQESTPYSKAVIANGLIYTSGQLGINPITKLLQPDLASQTKQIMENIKVLLQQNNSNMQRIIKVNIYLKDISQLKQVNEIYTSYLKERKPARTSVQINALPQDALIEIECIALVK